MKQNVKEAVKVIYNALDEKMGIDIEIIKIGEISSIADYFVIASANNSNQLKAMAEEVEEKLFQKLNIVKKHSEGLKNNGWILLDFGDIIVHLFDKENRDFYAIERIWSDADFLAIDNL